MSDRKKENLSRWAAVMVTIVLTASGWIWATAVKSEQVADNTEAIETLQEHRTTDREMLIRIDQNVIDIQSRFDRQE